MLCFTPNASQVAHITRAMLKKQAYISRRYSVRMTLLSAACKVVGGLLFTLFLVALVMAAGLAQFTDYGNLQPAVSSTILQQIPNMSAHDVSAVKSEVAAHCQRIGAETFNLADVRSGFPNATMRCSDVAAADAGGLKRLVAVGIFDYAYHKEYPCDFLSCMSQLPEQEKAMAAISSQANAFFKALMLWSVVGIIAGLALIALGTRELFGVLRQLGIEAIVSGAVSYAAIAAAKGIISAEAAANPELASLLSSLFGALSSSLVAAVAAGAVLAAAGFVGGRPHKKKRGK